MELLTANSEDEAKTSKPKTSSNDLSKSSSSIYGSLPRVASSNSRHLPTLPETGPLVRSMSLKDNSNVDDAPNSSSSSTNKPSSPPQSTQSHLSKSPQQQQSVLRRVNSAGGAPQTPLITDLMKPPAPTTTTSTTTTKTTTTNNNESGVFKVPPTPPKTLDLWYVQNSHTNQPTSA